MIFMAFTKIPMLTASPPDLSSLSTLNSKLMSVLLNTHRFRCERQSDIMELFCSVGKQAEYTQQKLMKKVLGVEATCSKSLRHDTGSDATVPRD
jgi:hypothetical protein